MDGDNVDDVKRDPLRPEGPPTVGLRVSLMKHRETSTGERSAANDWFGGD